MFLEENCVHKQRQGGGQEEFIEELSFHKSVPELDDDDISVQSTLEGDDDSGHRNKHYFLDVDHQQVCFHFYTKGGAPVVQKWVKTVAAKYPWLWFDLVYFEFDGDNNGYMVLFEGQVLEEFWSNWALIGVHCAEVFYKCHYYEGGVSTSGAFESHSWNLWDLDSPERNMVKARLLHYQTLGRCWDCSYQKWQRFCRRHLRERARRILRNHITAYLLRRLYRHPDGLRVPRLKADFERTISKAARSREGEEEGLSFCFFNKNNNNAKTY